MRALIVTAQAAKVTFLRERYLGTEWEVTDEPARAIELLSKEPFDRLFLDHWLHKEPANGRDVTIWLGQHPESNPQLTIIAMTDSVDKANDMIRESGRQTWHVPFDLIQALGT